MTIKQTNIGLRKGDRITVKNAILALVTRSANDVATVVGEHLQKSEINFAVAMTKKARSLHDQDSFPEMPRACLNHRQRSTARDMATLASNSAGFSVLLPFLQGEKIYLQGPHHRSHNKLLSRYSGTDGIKTGYTRASGSIWYPLCIGTVVI